MGQSDEQAEFRELLQRTRVGDETALERILTLTEGRLRRQVDRRLGARLRASLRRSDVLQNVYLTMVAALPDFVGDTADEFVAWVTAMIENDIRRQHRWFDAEKRHAPSRTSQRNVLASILNEPQPTPSAEVARGEERAAVLAAMQRLELDHQRVLQLSVFDELPHAEIAQRLDRTEGACRMLLLRARAALAIELDRTLGNGAHGASAADSAELA